MANFGDFLGTAGGGSLASSAIGAVTNVISANKQYRRQKELMKMQHQYQTAEREASQNWQARMWSVANDYNNPINVMSRLRAAGLSPDLFYKGDSSMAAATVPGSTAGVSPGVPVPAGEASSIAAADQAAKAALTAAQVRNLNKDSDKKEQETANLKVIQLKDGTEISLNLKNIEHRDAEIKKIETDINLGIQEAATLKAQEQDLYASVQQRQISVAEAMQRIDHAERSFQLQLEDLIWNIEKTQSEVKLNRATLSTYSQYMMMYFKEQRARINLLNAQGKEKDLANEEMQRVLDSKAAVGKELHGDDLALYKRLVEFSDAILENNSAKISTQTRRYIWYGPLESVTNTVISFIGALRGGSISLSSGSSHQPQPYVRDPAPYYRSVGL